MIRRGVFNIHHSWREVLSDEFDKRYFRILQDSIIDEINNQLVAPAYHLIFNAFNLCPFDAVRVVILGQDPYHNVGQAHGLCFSVPDGERLPPSLMNIFKEIRDDVGVNNTSGNLEPWAQQGIFLLNSILTVRLHEPLSHSVYGWELFTNEAVRKISRLKEGVVFMLWGNFARKKLRLIDEDKHHVLTSSHPSPLSAHNGFLGCRHFSKANAFLQSKIDWSTGGAHESVAGR